MSKLRVRSSWAVPVGSFAVAVVMAAFSGALPRATAFRAAGSPTGQCKHVPGLKETPPLCDGMQTGAGGVLVPLPACDDFALAPVVPGIADTVLFFKQVTFADTLAARTVRVLRAAKSGGKLHGLDDTAEEIHFTLTKATPEDCDPCHNITAFAAARTAINVFLEPPQIIGDASVGSGEARIHATREADCVVLVPAEVTGIFLANFFRQLTPAGEPDDHWDQDINGDFTEADHPLGAADPDVGVVVHVTSIPSDFGDFGAAANALNAKATLNYHAKVEAKTTRAAVPAPGNAPLDARVRSTVQLLNANLTCTTEPVGTDLEPLPKGP